MKGIVEHSGLIVGNKKEAIEEAKRVLDRMLEKNPHMKTPWVYVFRYDSPELIWFSVGYVKRDVVNHVQLSKNSKMSSEEWGELDRFRARVRSRSRP